MENLAIVCGVIKFVYNVCAGLCTEFTWVIQKVTVCPHSDYLSFVRTLISGVARIFNQ